MEHTGKFGTTVRKLRKEKGLTQKELAEKLFLTASAVSKWENKDVIPDGYILKELASIFEVSIEELLGTDTINVTADPEKSISQNSTSSKQTWKRKSFVPYLLFVIILTASLFVLLASLFHRQNLSKTNFEIVDEFYDNTSNYWGYEAIYHIVVVYDGTLDPEDQHQYTNDIRASYSNKYEDAEVIIVSFFETYDKIKDSVYDIENQSFLLPLNQG